MNLLKFQETIAALALLSLTLIGTGCTAPPPKSDANITAITVKGGDFNFELPQQAQAGLISITFENVGQEAHHLQLVELKEGVTIAQLLAELPKGEVALLGLLKGTIGGVGPIDPGGSGRVTVDLNAGNYALLCFLPSHDGVPHLAKGMVAPLTVTGLAPAYQAKPVAVGAVTLRDFAFTLPDAIKAGPQTWQVLNEGTQPHEMALMKLAEGKTMEDVAAFTADPHSQGQPPFENVGGFQGIDPGKTGWLHLDLTPGTYIAICHIPDAATGKAHSELGMVRMFSVK